MRQRFYSPKGYKPKTYGYRHAQDVFEPDLINAYLRLRGLVLDFIFTEPHSANSLSAHFRRREQGAKLLELLKPEDHLVFGRWEHVFYDRCDFTNQLRWFYERGVHVHFADISGSPLDCWSEVGRTYLTTLFNSVDLDVLCRRRLPPAIKKKPQDPSGKPLPWYCDLLGGQLSVPLEAGRILEQMAELRDEHHQGWTQLSHWLYDECQVRLQKKIATHKGKQQEAINAYCFYHGWREAGFPSLSSISPAQLKKNYKDKHFNGQAG